MVPAHALPRPAPRDPALRGRLFWVVFGLALLWPLLHLTRFSPGALLDPANLRPMAHYLAGFLPPAHDRPFLLALAQATLETLAIATAGMALAFVLAAPLGLCVSRALSTSRLGPRPRSPAASGLAAAVRGLLLILRGVPELIWALLFVRFFGLGPAAAVLALGLTYGGMLGKVYGEILDAADNRPARALQEAGAGRLAAFAYGLLPQAAAELLSYTVYRWECAVRASVIMGFVGAGGLGQLMDQAMKMLNGSEAASVLLAFLLLVALADLFSNRLRRALDHPGAARDAGLPPQQPWRLAGGAIAAALAVAAAFGVLGLSPQALWRESSADAALRFLADFMPPDLSATLWAAIADAALQTLAISALGTLLAVLGGAALALPASGRAGRGLQAAARSLLNLLRAVPELVWATQTVLLAGLGPMAGTLALALHTSGVLGRLFAEALENAPTAPADALRHAGAGRIATFCYGTLPLVAQQWVAYALYRWEINLRMAAVLGFVGAGGLGQMLYFELSLLRYPQVASIVIATLALALVVDATSARVRRRMG